MLLQFPGLAVIAARGEQLGVRASGDDPAFFHDQYFIHILKRADPVRNNQQTISLDMTEDGFQYIALGLVIDGR